VNDGDHLPKIRSAGSVLCEPGWSWDSPVLKDHDLWFVWAGQGTINWDAERIEISAGSCFCLRPGTAYRARQDPRRRLGVCFIHFDLPRRSKERLPHMGRLAEVDLYERLLKHVVALHQSGDSTAQHAAALHLAGVLASLRAAARRPQLSGVRLEHHHAIWAAARFIRENPGQLFSIEELSERANYSADHFSRLFREIVGQTPSQFCINTRLQRAQTLLQESSLSIEQIASALGYADVFFFSRQFKQRTGVSPSQWRRRVERRGGAV
jgi:AraC-like DNA-binding protein